MSFQLRPDQQQVVAYRKGYMAVPAVPGAGKTTVLAHLAADLIQSGAVAPGRILIVTYTNSAVSNFRSRIGGLLTERGLPGGRGYEVRTIHSLALYLVRERPDALGWSDSFTILDEAAEQSLLERLTLEWIGRNRAVWESMLKADLKAAIRERALDQWQFRTQSLFRSLIGAFKSRQISPLEALDLAHSLSAESPLRWAAEVYRAYQAELAARGAVDFGDLVLGAHRLITQEEDLLARLRRRWTYLFEDEAQDSYRLQEALLRTLAGPDGNLVRVGDANQAIMGTFTSAESDLFRRFCREESVSNRPLVMAGRSSPDIIGLANELVRWVREEYPEPLCRDALEGQFIAPVPPDLGSGNPAPSGYTIATRTYRSVEEEVQEVARLAARSVGRSPEKTLAVLLPTNAMAGEMVELLEAAGVPARQVGGSGVPERQAASLTLLAILAFLAEPHRPDLLVQAVCRLIESPDPLGEPFTPFLRECRPEELFYPQMDAEPFAALYAACPESAERPEVADALRLLAQWLQGTRLSPDELILQIALDLGLGGEPLSLAHYLSLRAGLALEANPAYGLLDVVRQLQQELPALNRFADIAYDRKGFKPEPGVVYVTTCHSAKGLEWDTVFVTALTRGEYPATRQDKVRSELWFLPDDVINPEALALAELEAAPTAADPVLEAKLEIIAERLRLLYVAITRAKENLLLSCHCQDRWGKPARPAPAYLHLAGIVSRRLKGE